MSLNLVRPHQNVFSAKDYQLIQIQDVPGDGNVKLEIPIVYSKELNEEPQANEELPSRYEEQIKSQMKRLLELKRDNLLKEKQVLQRKVDKYRRFSKNMNLQKEIMMKSGQWRMTRLRKACEKVFSKTQIELMLGRKRKHKWSHDDLAIAYNIITLGNYRCFAYVKEYMKIPLPSRGCLTKWLSVKPSAKKLAVNVKEVER
ncbi:uncharacterized protein LOC132702501 [Cylas formicarius]|uniref:uncharacterized protein LOC132702501 n=1 Tax=Cylas formicarius TaxID=197179 RepID=UPI0029583A8E|nr:uncharacterized protein LOC132702501 [Cylas formicarius]